jgi:hypothetical protein
MEMKRCPILFLILVMMSAGCVVMAQTVPSLDSIQNEAELRQAIATLDKQLFDAYNTCNLDIMGAMVTDDLEFYHDKTGLDVGRQIFLDKTKNNICGKVTRELVPGSLEVYPMNGYGALEIGTHRFHHLGEKNDVLGEAKFILLWQYKHGSWKIARVISYDHGTMK